MDPLPEEVKQFVEANVASVDQLEVLRLLGEDRQREWSAAELARELQAPPQDMPAQLGALQARGLLAVTPRGTELYCRHGARTPELEAMLDRLLQVYRQRPVTLIRLVSARANEVLRTFADAFRIRKEE